MLSYFTEKISDWKKLKKIVAIMIQYKQKLLNAIRQKRQCHNIEDHTSEQSYQDISILQKAEPEIIKMCQARHFWKEIKAVNAGNRVPRTSRIHKLHSFLDKDGVLRVGGGLVKSNLSHELKHPVLVPKYCNISQLIISYYHEKTAHSERGMTINEIRNAGYWIINCNSAVKSLIAKCVICRHLRGSICYQKMADLPRERLFQEPPFSYCGIDMFGPIVVKEGRKEMKRYGCLSTCLSSRAIHIESINSLSIDAFIQALLRFVSRRGNFRVIRTDNGTTFVGASAELNKAFSEMNHKKINEFMLEHGGQ